MNRIADIAPFKNALARILAPDARFCGIGYVVTPRFIITCAHVVFEALSPDNGDNVSPPSGYVLVQRPFAPPGSLGSAPTRCWIAEGGWYPHTLRPEALEPTVSDVAILRAQGELASPATPLARLSPALDLAGSDLIAFGGPEGHEQELIDLSLSIGHERAGGRYSLHLTGSTFKIEPGCSGAPVWNPRSSHVVGIIAQAERDETIDAGFLIPASQLRLALDAVGVHQAADLMRAGGLALVRYKVAGVALSRELRDRVKRFIDHYTGTPRQPVPFTGRQKEMAALDNWLSDVMQSVRGTFLLLSTAAGRGKSALLLHWMASLLESQVPLHVIFLPISIRFDLADEMRGLRLLYEQLASLFPALRFPEEVKPDLEDYRGRIQEGWEFVANRSGHRFLVVIDGIDEADDLWPLNDILPYEVPQNLAVVAAARYKPGHSTGVTWLDDFGLSNDVVCEEPMDLAPLTPKAVRQAIIQLGYPLKELVENDQILSELFRLTDEGDPLMVSLWAEQLWSTRDSLNEFGLEEIRRLRPGFGGYYDEWLREQRHIWTRRAISVDEAQFEQLLILLAWAKGPLLSADLSVLGAHLDPSIDYQVEGITDILGAASRLLVGDGKRQGFSFVHPRLADMFRERAALLSTEPTDFNEAYLVWGREVVHGLNTETITPKRCPIYLLRHYTAHVEAANLPNTRAIAEHYAYLLEGGWHRAWYMAEGTYRGFLADLNRVRDALSRANDRQAASPPYLAEELTCYLYSASIQSLSEYFPPILIVLLVEAHLWSATRALNVAAQIADPTARAECLRKLSRIVRPRNRSKAMEKALEAAEAIEEDYQRWEMLADLAAAVRNDRQLWEESLHAINTRVAAKYRAAAFGSIAEKVRNEPKSLGELLNAAAIEEADERIEAVTAVVEYLGGVPELQQRALNIACEIHGASDRVSALVKIAVHLEGTTKDQALSRALNDVDRVDDEAKRASLLASIAAQLDGGPRDRGLARALSITTQIQDRRDKVEALRAVAAHLAAQPDLIEEAVAVARSLLNDREGAECVEPLVAAMSRHPRLTAGAIELAGSITWSYRRDDVLAAIVDRILDQPSGDEAAFHAADMIESDLKRVEALATIAERSATPNTYLAKALEIVAALPNDSDRAHALAKLSARLISSQSLLYEATKIAIELEEVWRAKAISELAGQLAQYPELIKMAETAASNIKEPGTRAKALASLAEYMPKEKQVRALQEALEQVFKQTWGIDRNSTYFVIKKLTGRPVLLGTVLEWANRVTFDGDKANILNAVIEQSADQPQLLEKALDAATSLTSESDRARVFGAFANQAEGNPELLEKCVAAATLVSDSNLQYLTVGALLATLDGDARDKTLTKVIDETKHTSNSERRAEALIILAIQLHHDLDNIRTILEASQDIESISEGIRKGYQLFTDISISELLHKRSTIRAALEAIRPFTLSLRPSGNYTLTLGIFIPPYQLAVLGLLANLDQLETVSDLAAATEKCDTLATKPAFDRCLAIAKQIPLEIIRAAALVSMADHVRRAPGDSYDQIIKATMAIQDGPVRVATATELAPYTPRPLITLQRGIDTLTTIKDDSKRSIALRLVAQHLNKHHELRQRALDIASAIESVASRIPALTSAASGLRGDYGFQVMAHALREIELIDEDADRVTTLASVLPDLRGHKDCLRMALKTIEQIGVEAERAKAIALSAEYLEPHADLLETTFEIADGLQHASSRAGALVTVARHMKGSRQQRAIRYVMDIAVSKETAGEDYATLRKVAKTLEDDTRCQNELLDYIAEVPEHKKRATILQTAAGYLAKDDNLLEKALNIACNTEGRTERKQILRTIAINARGCASVQEKLFSMNSDVDHRETFSILTEIAPDLTKREHLEQLLELSHPVHDELSHQVRDRMDLIAAAAEPLGQYPDLLEQALDQVASESGGGKSKALAAIAGQVKSDTDMFDRVLDEAAPLKDGDKKADVFVQLINAWDPDLDYKRVARILSSASRTTRRNLLRVLAALSPKFAALATPGQVEDAVNAVFSVGRRFP